jgi:peptidoglycan/xylan/chitin deacetylase (PgdA/CDA1 family)
VAPIGVRTAAVTSGLAALAHAAPSTAVLAQWLPVRQAAGGWCTWRGPAHDQVALTFDDGPDPVTTGPLLDRLDELGVRGSFFVVGEAAGRHPDMVREIGRRGHTIGVHGHHHRHHLARTPRWTARDLAEAVRAVTELAPAPVRWFRPPYGQLAAASLWSAHRMGLRTVLWSAWGREWTTPDASEVVDRVLGQVEPGGTVLLHDSDATSPPGTAQVVLDALAPLVDGLHRRGLGTATLDELLGT